MHSNLLRDESQERTRQRNEGASSRADAAQARRIERAARAVLDAYGPPELDRSYVAGATVERDGTHFRIAAGSESRGELEASWARLRGRCACGGPLSISFRRDYCRRCES